MAFFPPAAPNPGAPGQVRDSMSAYPPNPATGANRPGMDYRRQRRQGMQPAPAPGQPPVSGTPTPGTGWEPYGGTMPGQQPGGPPLTGTPTPGTGYQPLDPSQLPNGGQFGWATPAPSQKYPYGRPSPIGLSPRQDKGGQPGGVMTPGGSMTPYGTPYATPL